MGLSVSTMASHPQGVFGLLGALSFSVGLSWKKTPKPQARAPLQGIGHAAADVCLLAAQHPSSPACLGRGWSVP